jgi:hypothetical protein
MHATYPSNLIFFYLITPVILERSKNSGAPWSSFCVFTIVKIACVIFVLIWLTIKWAAQLPSGLETTTHLFSVGCKTGSIVCWIFISGFQSNCYQYFTTYQHTVRYTQTSTWLTLVRVERAHDIVPVTTTNLIWRLMFMLTSEVSSRKFSSRYRSLKFMCIQNNSARSGSGNSSVTVVANFVLLTKCGILYYYLSIKTQNYFEPCSARLRLL